MKSKKPTELTNEELIKNEKTTKTAIILLACMLFILMIAAAFAISKQRSLVSLIAVPLGLMPIVIVLLNTWKELKKRDRQQEPVVEDIWVKKQDSNTYRHTPTVLFRSKCENWVINRTQVLTPHPSSLFHNNALRSSPGFQILFLNGFRHHVRK